MQRHLKNSAAVLAILAVFGFFSLPQATAQTIEYGKLTGVVTDDTGEPLPGVAVEVSSPALIGGKQATLTSGRGTYVFLNLPPGKYAVSASLQGFKTVIRENISVTAGSSLVIDLVMEPGRIEESVLVTAAGPVVDAKTSTISTSIQSELLAKLPTSRDAFYDLALTMPGMVAQGKDGDWLPSPNAYGGTSNENVFLINGVNTTNPRAAAYGSLVKVNYNAVEEVRVIALGSKAEYGSFSGVAIDVLTKSGSNDFHGNLSYYGMLGDAANNQPGAGVDLGSIGGNPLYIGGGDQIVKKSINEWELNFTLGGPVIRDKVWFYGGFDYARGDTVMPFWEPLNTYRGAFGDLKITAAPWTNHRAWVAFHMENNKGDGWTWSPYWDPTMTYGVKTKAYSLSSQWQWMPSGKTILTAKYLGFWNDDQPFIPDDPVGNPGFINWWKWKSYGVGGDFPYVEAQKSNRNTIQADVSHYAEDFLGDHDIKFGVQYTMGRGNWMGGYFQNYANFAYPAPWVQYIPWLQSWYGHTGLVMYNTQTWLNPFLTVRTSDSLGFFLDDQWTVGKRLTVNLGLRYDHMTAKYGEGKVYEYVTSPEEINGPPPVLRTRSGTDDVFNFKTLAPRVGITYAITKDMKTVFRANYGRYYLPLSVEYLRRFGPDMEQATVHNLYYNIPFDLVDLDGDLYISGDEAAAAARYLSDPAYLAPEYRPAWVPEEQLREYSWELKVQDGLKDQYTDQITLNLERELMANLALSATYIFKRTGNIFVQWPLNRQTQQPYTYQRVPYTTGYGENVDLYDIVLEDFDNSGIIDVADLVWLNNNIDREVRNMEAIDGFKPRRTYQGFQLQLQKRFSNRWQMMSSVLFSWSDGMAARSIRQDFNFEGPMVMDTNWLAGLNQTINTMEGPLPHTQKFEFKLSGSYLIPFVDLDLGLRFRYNSGRPVWPLEVLPVWPSWSAERPPGSIINTGDNYIVAIDPTDPWYLPSEIILDLRFEKSFRLAGYGSLRLSMDILNVFNEAAVTNAGYGGAHEPEVGRVSGITFPSRKFRLSVGFEF